MGGDGELWWAPVAGTVGLICWIVGSLVGQPPRPDADDATVATLLVERRSAMLAAGMLRLTAPLLLFWPLAIVLARTAWPALAFATGLGWVFAFCFLGLSTVLEMAAAWRGPAEVPVGTLRALLDASHLATWAASAPAAALAVAATTGIGYRWDHLGVGVVVLAVIKVATVVVEVAGTGRRSGWNVGGHAAGISGYASVAWFGAVIWSIAP